MNKLTKAEEKRFVKWWHSWRGDEVDSNYADRFRQHLADELARTRKEVLELEDELLMLRGMLMDSYGNFKPNLEKLKNYMNSSEPNP